MLSLLAGLKHLRSVTLSLGDDTNGRYGMFRLRFLSSGGLFCIAGAHASRPTIAAHFSKTFHHLARLDAEGGSMNGADH